MSARLPFNPRRSSVNQQRDYRVRSFICDVRQAQHQLHPVESGQRVVCKCKHIGTSYSEGGGDLAVAVLLLFAYLGVFAALGRFGRAFVAAGAALGLIAGRPYGFVNSRHGASPLHGLDVLVAQRESQRGAGGSSTGSGDFHEVLQTDEVDVDVHDIILFQFLGSESAAGSLLFGEHHLIRNSLEGSTVIAVRDGEGISTGFSCGVT